MLVKGAAGTDIPAPNFNRPQCWLQSKYIFVSLFPMNSNWLRLTKWCHSKWQMQSCKSIDPCSLHFRWSPLLSDPHDCGVTSCRRWRADRRPRRSRDGRCRSIAFPRLALWWTSRSTKPNTLCQQSPECKIIFLKIAASSEQDAWRHVRGYLLSRSSYSFAGYWTVHSSGLPSRGRSLLQTRLVTWRRTW